MPGKPYHHGDLRGELIEATRQVLEAEGVEAVTIARIARECGVSVAAPYRHFSDKQALLGAVARIGFSELRDALAGAARTGGDPLDRLTRAGVAYVDHALAHPELFRLMFSAALRDRQHEAGPAALDGLRTLVEPLELTVDLEVAVRAAWALAHGLASLRLGGMLAFTRDDTEARLHEELRVLLTGIVATSSPTGGP